MADSNFLPAIREALKQNESGDAPTYALSYAKLGKSGASFGIFQGDTAAEKRVLDVLRQVLEAAKLDPVVVTSILAKVSVPCPNGSRLTDGESKAADAALDSDRGRALVDAMDRATLDIALAGLDSCIAAAGKKGWLITPEAQLYIPLWVNMTGPPTLLLKWLGGTPVLKVPPPAGPDITKADMETYLGATSYFVAHAKNFKTMKESVAAGAKLLPQMANGGNK